MLDQLSSDYFSLFGLTQGYDVDRDKLEERFRTLQNTMHPDRFAGASDQEKRIAMQKAAHINEAYRVLKDPIARARYMLEHGGYNFQDQQATHQDPEFLMEQMKLRETLGEVREQKDPVAVLAAVIERIDGSFKHLDNELSEVLGASGSTASDKAVEIIQRMQFFRRLAEEASELEALLEEELDDF